MPCQKIWLTRWEIINHIKTGSSTQGIGQAILFFLEHRGEWWADPETRRDRLMKHTRLSKSEAAQIIETALRARAQRAAANRMAQAKRKAAGVIRVERTLPAEIVTELRRIVGAVIAAHDAGDRIALRINLPIADSAGQTDHGIETRNNTTGKAKPEQVRSTQPMDRRAKKRAQTARRRARAAAEGKIRATFEIPAALRGELAALLDRAASALAQGANVSVEPDIAGHMAGPQAPSDDTPPPRPESQPTLHHSDRRSDSPYQNRQETPLTDLFATENTKADTLFWDIKAAGRI
jgi:hypothetical protein